MQCHIAHCNTVMKQYGMVCIAHNSHYFLSIFAMFNHLMLVNVIFLSCPIRQLSQAHFKCENVCISCIECNQFNRIMQNICRMYFSCTNYTSVNKNGHKKIHRRKAASASAAKATTNRNWFCIEATWRIIYWILLEITKIQNGKSFKWKYIGHCGWRNEQKKKPAANEMKKLQEESGAPTNRINQCR